jgi:hypothetical protein
MTWERWVGAAVIAGVILWFIYELLFQNSEPNICSLEFRDVYLQTHDNDDELCKECPSEPWCRKD